MLSSACHTNDPNDKKVKMGRGKCMCWSMTSHSLCPILLHAVSCELFTLCSVFLRCHSVHLYRKVLLRCMCHFISMLSGAPTIHTSPGYYGNKRPLGINLSPMCVQNMSTTSQCGDNPTYICVVSLYCRSCAANLTTLFAPKCKQDETSLFGPDVH